MRWPQPHKPHTAQGCHLESSIKASSLQCIISTIMSIFSRDIKCWHPWHSQLSLTSIIFHFPLSFSFFSLNWCAAPRPLASVRCGCSVQGRESFVYILHLFLTVIETLIPFILIVQPHDLRWDLYRCGTKTTLYVFVAAFYLVLVVIFISDWKDLLDGVHENIATSKQEVLHLAIIHIHIYINN